ncbi:hypothetical protein ACI48D_03525 [Massilia sp. LXY-6]|uniref:hypothetical protein n=1 Tax=Massilia sp. LXY-6 TaxID=3379823 RepID=UPI003EE40C9C
MRALSLFLATTALLTTVGAAQADAGSTEPLSTTAQQMDEVTGTYKLSDGRRAELFVLDNRIYVRIGSGQQKELHLAGTDRFASLDGRLSVQFGPRLATDHIVLAQDRSIAGRDTIRLASNERAGRGSAD